MKISQRFSDWVWAAVLAGLLTLTLFTVSQARNFGSIHLLMGSPSNATTNPNNANDFLLVKRQYALSYNNSKGTANWVSWQLNASWQGSVDRCKRFSPDLTLTFPVKSERGANLHRGLAISTNLAKVPEYQ